MTPRIIGPILICGLLTGCGWYGPDGQITATAKASSLYQFLMAISGGSVDAERMRELEDEASYADEDDPVEPPADPPGVNG